jgi:hypothetical protein
MFRKLVAFVLGAGAGAFGMWAYQRGTLDDVQFQSPIRIEAPKTVPGEPTQALTVPESEGGHR